MKRHGKEKNEIEGGKEKRKGIRGLMKHDLEGKKERKSKRESGKKRIRTAGG